MAIDRDCCTESLHPKHFVEHVKYKYQFMREHPDYFNPDGLIVFCGAQGTGKTLSAVNYVVKLLKKYPKCKLVTNIQIEKFPIVDFAQFKREYYFEDMISQQKPKLPDAKLRELYLEQNRIFDFKDNDDFAKYNNGECGVIFFVDEIQLYLNSLESKNINLEVITQISQQRKQRKHIVATSQVFGRLAKPLREQFSNVILCKAYFGVLQCNQLLDRDSLQTEESTGTNISGQVVRKFWWFRSPFMFSRYDTYRVIARNSFVSGEKKLDIYDSKQVVGGVPSASN